MSDKVKLQRKDKMDDYVHSMLSYELEKTRCGRAIQKDTKYATTIEEVTCPECKMCLINFKLGELAAEMDMHNKLRLDCEHIYKKRDKYLSMV